MDPKKLLTEEMPETPADLDQRQLNETPHACSCGQKKILTEDLPQEEDEDEKPRPLTG